jgi:uncharacterized protein (TIRG00374 family)
VGWLLLTALVVVAALEMDWRLTLGVLANAHPLWLVLAVLANGAILPVATVQWLLFLPSGARIPPGRMFSIVALTASVSNGGPPFAGHATGIHLLATRGGIGHSAGVSLTILDQIAEGLAKFAIVALAAAMVPGFEYRTAGLTIAVGAPALALGFTALAHRGHLVERLASRTTGQPARVLGFLSRTVQHLDALRRPAAFVPAVALAVGKKGLEALGIWVAAVAVGLSLPLWVAVAVVVAVNLSSLVAPTPAHLGVYEGSAFLVLRAAGIEADLALAVALVGHAAYLLPLAGTGWIVESLRPWQVDPHAGVGQPERSDDG